MGNFNSDGFTDLAIGAPGETRRRRGEHPLRERGRPDRDGEPAVDAGLAGIGDDPEPGDHFGATLAAGNLDTSTVASELVIGVPDEDLGPGRTPASCRS